MKKLSTRIIVAVLVIAGSSGAVYAYSRHGGWHMSPDEKVEFVTDRVTKKLQLDASQQQKFNDFAQLVAETLQEVRPSREERLTEAMKLLDEPSFNQARALELIEQKTSLVNEKAPLLVSSLAIFLDSLNAEQKQQMQEFMQHRLEHHGHRH